MSPADFTSLEARDRNEDFSISTFPNPAQDVLQIKWKPIQQPIKMHLTDISGKVVWQQQNVDGVQGFKSVNVSRLIPGTYILTHASAQGTFNQKINILR
ncbi:MAG: T9SS type A sorting domain-containing protein [Saprospiraceae bacterium]|nr:T9SS type A sorting domain-containing protein [Saprospiraceae bacterium]